MRELVKKTQEDWLKAKAEVEARCINAGKQDIARKFALCNMFKGTEDLRELADLIFTPQGIEFVINNRFPDLNTFRRFKPYKPERYGIYIDCGQISLNEQRRVLLVGKTSATLNYKATEGSNVYLMHGAKASVVAGGYAVVKVKHDTVSSVSILKQEHAFVL